MSRLRCYVAGVVTGAFAFVVFFAVAAHAQEAQCGPRADLVKMLGEKYHEVPIAIGMINEGVIMETFASNAGTWTMFMTNADGRSCLAAEGSNWRFDTSAFDAAKQGEDF